MLPVKFTFCFFSYLLGFALFAQQNKNDSLRTVLKTAKEDTNKANTLNLLSRQMWQSKKLDTATLYAQHAMQLAKTINFPKGEANAFNNLGNISYFKGDYPDALKNHFSALKIHERTGDKKGVAYSCNNIGIIYYSQANYEKALSNYNAALKIYEESGDKKGAAGVYNNTGATYESMGNYTEALKNHFAALKIREELDDKKGIAGSYNNIGAIYSNQGHNSEALKYYLTALQLKEETGDRNGSITTLGNIGHIQLKLNDPVSARKNFRKALLLAEETGSMENIGFAYRDLAKADSALNDPQNALKNYKLYILYRDSLFNEKNTEKTVQLQMQYEFDKIQTADSLKVAEERKLNDIRLQQEKTQRYYLYAGLALVLVFSGFLFNRFRLIQKQKQIIELKERETQQQKHLVEEKNKEITDSITYAKRLQEAILPPQQYISQYLPGCFVVYQPKAIVAGDFYWAEAIGDLFFIAAADSTGHGVPGAMVSVVCSNALDRTVKEFGLKEPGKILDKTRELVLETFSRSSSEVKDGMDISLLCIDRKHKKVSWSGANNPLWYVAPAAASLLEIKADKQPIGKTDHPKPFTTHEIAYQSNTTFYLLTDGYPDQFGGPKGKKFKYKKLKELIFFHHSLSPSEQAEVLTRQFNDWKGDLEQVDDVTVIGIRL